MSMFEIRKVTVTPKSLIARVRIQDGAPLKTSEDLEATNRVYELMPLIGDHACVNPSWDHFRDVLNDTGLAHVLEHVAVELLARYGATSISTGRTHDTDDPRTWEIELACPDDALTLGALSSAAWIMEWAFTGGNEPAPDINNIVDGLKKVVASLPQS